MALQHAILGVLLDGPATGYDLAKRFDRSVANFWHATRQQIYAELERLEADGLIRARLVRQHGRPNKRLFRVTETGRRLLAEWLRQPSRPTAIKDEMLVRVQSASAADSPILLDSLNCWRAARAARLQSYLTLRDQLLDGRAEVDYLASTDRPGGYLTLARGIAFERENLAWADWVAAVIRQRVPVPPSASASTRGAP